MCASNWTPRRKPPSTQTRQSWSAWHAWSSTSRPLPPPTTFYLAQPQHRSKEHLPMQQPPTVVTDAPINTWRTCADGTRVHRLNIIGTDTLVYSAWVPTPSGRGLAY